MVDMYIAFIEKIESLAINAIIICPASVRTSQASRILREHLIQKARVKSVYDHGHQQRFPDASVNTAYIVIGANPDEFLTVVAPCGTKYLSPLRNLAHGEAWVSAAASTGKDVRLRDVCDISVGIATLADKVYVLRPVHESSGAMVAVHTPVGIREIEGEILKPIIKASIAGEGQNFVILCPYSVSQTGKHEIIPEDVMASSFPNAYRYLCDMRVRLDKRDKGKGNPVAWYAFGRTQGLSTVSRDKIVFSPMADCGQPHFCIAPAGTYYYSGYAAFPKPNATLGDIEIILTSDGFKAHLEVHGRKMSGSWTSCSKSEIQDMPVQELIDVSAFCKQPDLFSDE